MLLIYKGFFFSSLVMAGAGRKKKGEKEGQGSSQSSRTSQDRAGEVAARLKVFVNSPPGNT